jgi:hypothetical protein
MAAGDRRRLIALEERRYLKMKHRIVVTTMALSLSLLTAPTLLAAPMSGLHLPVHAKMGKDKAISFQLRNASQTAMTVKAGDQQVTIEAGKVVSLKLPEGTQIVAVNATAKHAAGEMLVTVDSNLSGNTLVVD